MNKYVLGLLPAIALSIMLYVLCSFSPATTTIPPAYTGEWYNDSTTLTVRVHAKGLKYCFVKGRVAIRVKITSDGTATGVTGDAKFTQATVVKNKGNEAITGIAYKVKCGMLGKMFHDDPLESKPVELWLKPVKKDGVLVAEIRQKDGWDAFPMGECITTKK